VGSGSACHKGPSLCQRRLPTIGLLVRREVAPVRRKRPVNRTFR